MKASNSNLLLVKLIFVAAILCFAIDCKIGSSIADDSSPIKIGWSGPLSGSSAVLGIDSVAAVELVFDKVNQEGGINGRKLELLVEDDGYDTARALSAYAKLAQLDKCDVIIANTYGGIFATAERTERDGVVLINPLDCNEEIAALPQSVLCLATQSESVGIAIAEEILKRQETITGIIFDQHNPFMLLVEKSISQRLGNSGQEIKYRTAVSSDERDFKPQLLKARQAGVNALIFLGHDTMGQAMNQARQLGIEAQFYTVGTITSPGFQALAGKSAEGALVAFWEAARSKEYQEFIEAFKARVGRAPLLELASIPSFDTAMLIVKALRESVSESGGLDKSMFLKALYQVKDYEGASGRITVDPDGAVRTLKERVYKYVDRQLQPID